MGQAPVYLHRSWDCGFARSGQGPGIGLAGLAASLFVVLVATLLSAWGCQSCGQQRGNGLLKEVGPLPRVGLGETWMVEPSTTEYLVLPQEHGEALWLQCGRGLGVRACHRKGPEGWFSTEPPPGPTTVLFGFWVCLEMGFPHVSLVWISECRPGWPQTHIHLPLQCCIKGLRHQAIRPSYSSF